MPRRAREVSVSGIYHIILRGINRQTIFEDDEDKIRFLKTLKKYRDAECYELYSYCLMDNHVHLLMKELDESCSQFMKRISSSYVLWYNNKYSRCGHLFQERFKSKCVDTKRYFKVVLRYIHQNPMKAGLALCVWDCNWTRIHEYLSGGELVNTEYGLTLFSSDSNNAR